MAGATAVRAEPAARPKMAALILQASGVDEDLADNLTEVLISRLARRGEIAGKEEFKTKLGVDDQKAAECMQNVGCLGRAGTELGVTRLVVGTLGRHGADYLYNLNLIDVGSGRVENRVFELVAGGKVDGLIGAVKATADKLFQPKVEPSTVRVSSETRGAFVYFDEAFIGSTPVRRDGVEPGPHKLRVEKEGHLGWTKEVDVPAGSLLEVKVPLEALPKKRSWPGALIVTFAVEGALDVVVGVVLLALAADAPALSTVSRREAIDSAERRFVMNRTGIALLSLAGGLGIASGALAIHYRRDLFDTEKHTRERVVLGLAPSAQGLVVGATVPF
jgi:hypothetical protein